ncbi:MAG: pimeloyl-ACP methyl ester carboxylesterase [Planctomycetota bacterium]|jgi:pimeloyl-ACP methyl ester carboxylesterase
MIDEEPLPQRNDKRQPVRQRWCARWWRPALVLFVGWWVIGWLGAYASTQPHSSDIRERRTIVGHAIEKLEVTTTDGLTVRSWLLDVPSDRRRCVILAAGIRGNRERMVSRAQFYADLGWSSLLVDLRGTGNSDPARISMGWHEAIDLVAWYDVLRKRGYEVVGVHGQSLGAAAAAYTSVRTANPPAWDFVVLEACYSDITAALQSRAFGLPTIVLLPVFTCAEWLLDLDADDLNPVAALREQPAPLLVACGTLDHKVGIDATTRLLAASPAKDKVRCDVPGVGHHDLWRGGGGSELRAALREFLKRR